MNWQDMRLGRESELRDRKDLKDITTVGLLMPIFFNGQLCLLRNFRWRLSHLHSVVPVLAVPAAAAHLQGRESQLGFCSLHRVGLPEKLPAEVPHKRLGNGRDARRPVHLLLWLIG